MKNILIVSDDFFTDLGNAMWRINTNYTVIKCTDFKNYDFRKYIKANPSIVLTRSKDFRKYIKANPSIVLTRSKDLENETPVKFAEFLNEYNIRLIVFPNKKKKDIPMIIGTYLAALHDDVQIVTEDVLNREDQDICIRQLMNND